MKQILMMAVPALGIVMIVTMLVLSMRSEDRPDIQEATIDLHADSPDLASTHRN